MQSTQSSDQISKHQQQALRRVEREIKRGVHDSSQGLRPSHAFIDRDGDIAVWYDCVQMTSDSWAKKVA